MGYIIAGISMIGLSIWLLCYGRQDTQKQINIKNQNNIQVDSEDRVLCPKCHSQEIQLMKRGWKITTGFIGSSRNIRVCKSCLHKF